MNEYVSYNDGVVSVWCKECGHEENIPCTRDAYNAMMNRTAPIQNILPDTEPAIREMFTSGWCDICFKMNTSLLPDKVIHEILGHAVRLGLLTEEDKKEVEEAMCLYLDPQRYIIDMLTELEWQDGDDGGEDLRPQLKEFREKILEIYKKAMDGEYNDRHKIRGQRTGRPRLGVRQCKREQPIG